MKQIWGGILGLKIVPVIQKIRLYLYIVQHALLRGEKKCTIRESNSGRVNGNHAFYH